MSNTKRHPSVFEALDFEDAREREAVGQLHARLLKTIKERDLSYEEAAETIGCTPERVRELHRADAPTPGFEELFHCLVALGYDVDIAIRPSGETKAHLCVVG